MRSYTKRIRALRRLAIAGCLAALAVPAGASAMVPSEIGVRHENAQQSQSQSQYTLPSGFRTEAQTAAQSPAQESFGLRRSFRPEVQTQAPAHASIPAPSVIRQIETVNDDSGRTLALVIAGLALAVALGSLGYATTRMTPRRQAGIQ